MSLDLSSIFSLGGILLTSGKTEQAIGSLLTLEPVIADSMSNGSFDKAKLLATFERLAASGQITTQTKAAATLITVAGDILADPKHGPQALAAVRNMLGIPKIGTAAASKRVEAPSAFARGPEAHLGDVPIAGEVEAPNHGKAPIAGEGAIRDDSHMNHDDQAGASIPHD